MENEIWRDIEGYENKYQVSNMGRVRSLDRFKKGVYGSRPFAKGKILSLAPNKNGYLNVCLYSDKPKVCMVHRLVAKAFPEICGKLTDELQVDHINTVRNDNRAENLKACTKKENDNNPLTRKHKSQVWNDDTFKKTVINKIKKPIVQLAKDGSFCKVYDSALSAYSETNAHYTKISMCCNGKRKTAGGYYWFFLEDDETRELVYD